MITLDVDRAATREKLIAMKPYTGVEAWPRKTTYGSIEAAMNGLIPVEDGDLTLIPNDELREAVVDAHEKQTMPMYHQRRTWRPEGYRWNQDGIGYCWTWSGTGCWMTTCAMESKEFPPMAPVSMGYLVQWRDRGNYLESFIKGAREDGICPAIDGNMNDHSRNASRWDSPDRAKYKLDLVWDCDRRSMTQHAISILCYGRSLYVALAWWGHALEVVGVDYDDSGQLIWYYSNSHNEDDLIILKGSRAIPDECYGFISTKLV